MISFMPRPILFPLAAIALLAAPRAEAQGLRRGFVRAEIGLASLHASEAGSYAAVHLGRALDGAGTRRWDLGFKSSRADEGFFAITLGPEWRFAPAAAVTPVVGVGVGFLGESNEFMGATGYLTGALEIAPAEALGLRVGAEVAFHGKAAGPNVLFVAMEFRGKGI